MMASQPPAGFELNSRKSPLTDPWEPLYVREGEDKGELGLVVAEPHTNSRGQLHGGLIAALSDKVMGTTCGQAVRRKGLPAAGLVTVSLAVDYMGQAKIGDWLACQVLTASS
jgi:acyl-coenzyme A thioesterase PaaI-like protein